MVQRGYRIQKNHGASVDGNAHHGERIVDVYKRQDGNVFGYVTGTLTDSMMHDIVQQTLEGRRS